MHVLNTFKRHTTRSSSNNTTYWSLRSPGQWPQSQRNMHTQHTFFLHSAESHTHKGCAVAHPENSACLLYKPCQDETPADEGYYCLVCREQHYCMICASSLQKPPAASSEPASEQNQPVRQYCSRCKAPSVALSPSHDDVLRLYDVQNSAAAKSLVLRDCPLQATAIFTSAGGLSSECCQCIKISSSV